MTGAQIAIPLCRARSSPSNPSPLESKPTLEPKPPVPRYEYDKPGGMIHIDMKSTAASREAAIPSQATEQARERPAALAGGLPDEKKETACAFTSRACANGLTQRRIDHPPTGPSPSSSGPFGARQTRCRDQHQGRRDCDGDRAHGHAEPERPLFELLPDIGRHRMRANWR